MKSAWIGSGFSHQSVPSLSKTATRSPGGMPSADTRSTKPSTAALAAPAFQEASASVDAHCADVNAISSFLTTWSIVKLAASCRGGNSLKVSRNWVTMAVAANAM